MRRGFLNPKKKAAALPVTAAPPVTATPVPNVSEPSNSKATSVLQPSKPQPPIDVPGTSTDSQSSLNGRVYVSGSLISDPPIATDARVQLDQTASTEPPPRPAVKSKKPKKAKGNPVAALDNCLTLDEDGETRCSQPPTKGWPKPERCEMHHGQYQKMTKKYKDASKYVDLIHGGSEIPTLDKIKTFTDLRSTSEKAQWMKKYVEAIRDEKTGREIHHKRFFLKCTPVTVIRFKIKVMAHARENS
jgi:hypothetical protein